MKITILEFTPCADLIYHIRRDPSGGYITGDAATVTLKTGTRLRPRLVTTYAGGKATNIARVIDSLLTPEDNAEVELAVFRSDSAEGRYIQELEIRDLSRVSVRPIIVDSETRFCANVSDPASEHDNHVEFNISPHVRWRESALESALEFASVVKSDLLLMAGGPPLVGESEETAGELYARVIERLRGEVGVVSLDTDKSALANCLKSPAQPDVIKINEHEYASVEKDLWRDFAGTLIVTDSAGCLVWGKGCSGTPARIEAATVRHMYSTVGAGDAMHAGFSVARWVRGLDLLQAARFGQAAAAAVLTSPEASRRISNEAAQGFFQELTAR
jgi:fructose-1-phosphate kinase PfkB-like protein